MKFLDLTAPELRRLAPEAVAVLPLAAVEQHGEHLAVGTDTLITAEFTRRLELARPRQVLALPVLWAGSSHHHLAFSGTLSLSSETYVRVLGDLIDSLVGSGFRRIFLLNGHGGNQTPFAEALYRRGLRREGVWIAAQSYWKIAAKELAESGFMETPALSHACEYETSMMLALDPSLARMELARGARASRASAFYDPLGACSVVVSEPFDQLTENGALGSPELATAEKGRRLFDLISPVLERFIDDFARWPLPEASPTREAR